MTIKQLAFDAQQHLQTTTGTPFKRSHVYELFAAGLGFNSFASLCAEHVFTHGGITSRQPLKDGELVGRRSLDLGYSPETAIQIARFIPDYLVEQSLGVIRITDLIAQLRYAAGFDDETFEEESEDEEGDSFDSWLDRESIVSPILIEGLVNVASNGNANAHYALALIHAPGDDLYEEPGTGGEYWYNEERSGRVLTGVEKEWADQFAAELVRAEKFEHHLRAAGALGHEDALLDLAEQFGDRAFFERSESCSPGIDAVRVANIAEYLDRSQDAWRWLTEAAKRGDTESMRELIEGYDRSNQQQCWTWFYLAELLGTDMSANDYRAINEDGSDYDDDVGGPVFVGGRGGVELEQIDAEQDDAARQAADALYQTIKASRRE